MFQQSNYLGCSDFGVVWLHGRVSASSDSVADRSKSEDHDLDSIHQLQSGPLTVGPTGTYSTPQFFVLPSSSYTPVVLGTSSTAHNLPFRVSASLSLCVNSPCTRIKLERPVCVCGRLPDPDRRQTTHVQ